MAEYVKEKKKVLKELGIKLTKAQSWKLAEFKDEASVDRFVHDVIINYKYDD